MISLLVVILFVPSASGLIMPMTKPDGSLDVSSLISHIGLLEQTLESKASAVQVAELQSQLKTTQEKLAATEIQVAVLQTKLESVNSQCSCNVKPAISNSSSDLKHLQTDISSLKTDVFQLKSLHNATQNASYGGATFTRWGRTVCPVGNKMIYKGYTGGSHYSDRSSSATTLCLPDHPIYDKHTSDGHGATIYGTEYEPDVNKNTNLWKDLNDEDIPCVVCESETKRSAIMVPARNQCYPDWSLEYSGYLAGTWDNESSGEYICVDKDPESIPGGQKNENGHDLAIVESMCGPLPCPPYQNHWELTCAVCSR